MARRSEVGAVALGRTSAWGSICSTKWTAVKLLDMARRRVNGGGCGYDGGAVATASAMVGSAKERCRGEWGVREVGATSMGSSTRQNGVQGEAGELGGGATSSGARPCSSLPTWREEAAGWHGPAQCWDAKWAAR